MSSTPARTHKPHWQRRPERRPDEILDAAPRVFTRCGLHKTNLEEAAKEAGISKGTIYLYFKDKEKLFVAAAQRVAPNPDEIYGGTEHCPPTNTLVGLLDFDATTATVLGYDIATQPRAISTLALRYPSPPSGWERTCTF